MQNDKCGVERGVRGDDYKSCHIHLKKKKKLLNIIEYLSWQTPKTKLFCMILYCSYHIQNMAFVDIIVLSLTVDKTC